MLTTSGCCGSRWLRLRHGVEVVSVSKSCRCRCRPVLTFQFTLGSLWVHFGFTLHGFTLGSLWIQVGSSWWHHVGVKTITMGLHLDTMNVINVHFVVRSAFPPSRPFPSTIPLSVAVPVSPSPIPLFSLTSVLRSLFPSSTASRLQPPARKLELPAPPSSTQTSP